MLLLCNLDTVSMPQLSENFKITDIFHHHNNWKLTNTC